MKREQSKKSDNIFLKQIVDNFQLFYDGKAAGIKDINSHKLTCTEEYADLIKLSKDEVINSDNVFPNTPEYKKIIRDQDLAIISSRLTHKYLEIYDYSMQKKAYVFTKSPLINRETNNVVGIIYEAQDLAIYNLRYSMITKNKFQEELTEIDISRLKPRDYEVLFCHILGFISMKEIAKAINYFKGNNELNYFDIQYTMKRIFKITDTTSIEQAIDKLYFLGFEVEIPSTILKEGTYLIDVR